MSALAPQLGGETSGEHAENDANDPTPDKFLRSLRRAHHSCSENCDLCFESSAYVAGRRASWGRNHRCPNRWRGVENYN
jgi:hypothetical protein